MRRPRLDRTPLAALAALSCLALLAPAATAAAKQRPSCKPSTVAAASAPPRAAATPRLARAAVCLINRRRVARGLRKLRLNRRLSRAARRHTRDMVRHRYFSHVSRNGGDISDRLHRSGYLGGRFSWTVGENLAWGAGRRGTPREIVRSWMRSPGHRRNMLSSRFREIGIGVVARAPIRSSARAATYTTTFGSRG
ncbi:MAG: CAP domain-containing protein [Thermoleophilaceae bacterium]